MYFFLSLSLPLSLFPSPSPADLDVYLQMNCVYHQNEVKPSPILSGSLQQHPFRTKLITWEILFVFFFLIIISTLFHIFAAPYKQVFFFFFLVKLCSLSFSLIINIFLLLYKNNKFIFPLSWTWEFGLFFQMMGNIMLSLSCLTLRVKLWWSIFFIANGKVLKLPVWKGNRL